MSFASLDHLVNQAEALFWRQRTNELGEAYTTESAAIAAVDHFLDLIGHNSRAVKQFTEELRLVMPYFHVDGGPPATAAIKYVMDQLNKNPLVQAENTMRIGPPPQ